MRVTFQVLAFLFGVAILGCASATRPVASADANEPARSAPSSKTNNEELTQLFQQDQDERTGKAPRFTIESDAARRQRVRQILDRGEARTSADYYHAAMVFQHGTQPADYELARTLALKAVDLDPMNTSAKWLAAAAEDRLLMNLGKPQRFGTQFRCTGGEWVLWEVDPSVTDEERARWNVPPLAEAQERARRLRAGST